MPHICGLATNELEQHFVKSIRIALRLLETADGHQSRLSRSERLWSLYALRKNRLSPWLHSVPQLALHSDSWYHEQDDGDGEYSEYGA